MESTNNQINYFDILPNEITTRILSESENPYISSVCKNWQSIINDPFTIFNFLKEKTKNIKQITQQLENIEDKKNRIDFLKGKILNEVQFFTKENTIDKFSQFQINYSFYVVLVNVEKDKNLLTAFEAISPQIENLKVLFNSEEFQELNTFQKALKLRNELREINEEDLKKITEICLKKKGLTTIPEEINLFTNLKEIDLSFNKIKNIPSNFCSNCPHIEKMDLAVNKIETLHDDFGSHWPKLTNLSLMHNRLKELPDQLGNKWIEFRTLDLTFNQLENLPENFGKNWENLLKLTLSYNQLKSFPKKSNWKKIYIFDTDPQKAK